MFGGEKMSLFQCRQSVKSIDGIIEKVKGNYAISLYNFGRLRLRPRAGNTGWGYPL